MMSDGQGEFNGEVEVLSAENDGMQSMVVRTDIRGEAQLSSFLRERQSSKLRRIFPEAEAVLDQRVTVDPLRGLPKGSKIDVSVPKP